MNKTFWILTVALALAGVSCSAMEETMVSAVFANYTSVQEALAEDDSASAREALRALAQEPDPEIREAAKAALEAEDLKAVRKQFKLLSSKVEKLELPKGYVVAYCPMADDGKGATWVQKDGEIENPYFGSEMLKCGEVTKRVE